MNPNQIFNTIDPNTITCIKCNTQPIIPLNLVTLKTCECHRIKSTYHTTDSTQGFVFKTKQNYLQIHNHSNTLMIAAARMTPSLVKTILLYESDYHLFFNDLITVFDMNDKTINFCIDKALQRVAKLNSIS